MRTLICVVTVVAMASCTWGVNECSETAPCTAPGQCVDGFCVLPSDTGGGTGGSAGGTGGGTAGGSGGTGGGSTSCDAVSCSVWQECAPSTSGGTCQTAYAVTWTAPTNNVVTNNTTVAGMVLVTRLDGGTTSTIPDVWADTPGATVIPQSSANPRSVQLSLNTSASDGEYVFSAGWDGGPTTTVTVVLDKTGPEFVVIVPPATPAANTIVFYPNDPAVDGGWYRKDDIVMVQAVTDAGDVDAGSVKLVAQFEAQTSVEVTASTGCTPPAGGACHEFALDLSLVPMNAFRGHVNVTIVSTDVVGNPGSVVAPGAVPVTRWNWARQIGTGAAELLKSTPAIGSGGRVFLGRNGLAGGVIAIDPSGNNAWNQSDGNVVGPIATAQGTGSNEYVAWVSQTSGTLRAARTESGMLLGGSCAAGDSGEANSGGVVVINSQTAQVASVALQPGEAAIRGNKFIFGPPSCHDTPTETGVGIQAPGNMVVGSGAVFFVDSGGILKMLKVPAGSSALDALGVSVGGVGIVNGLAAISGTRVAGGGGPGIGHLFAFDIFDAGSGTHDAGVAWPTPTVLSAPTSGPSVGASGIFAQYRADNRSTVLRVDPLTGVVGSQTAQLSANGVNSSFTGNGVPTPTLGEGGMLYAVDARGNLFVLPQNFSNNDNATWGVGMRNEFGTTVSASPALDCNRLQAGSETGVIYIATDSGWLVSYLVDSKGLDPTAPWPKYARDARNTGNFFGPAIGCP